MNGEKTVLYIKGISAEIKRHFKAYCAKRNISMKDAIEEMMREKIKKG